MPTPTARRKMIEDQKSAAARAYLEGALPLGIWAEASKKIGHNHAFIQQFIRRGKPRFLTEPDRDLLVRTYDLDAEMLRPPRKSVRPIRRRPPRPAPRPLGGQDQRDVVADLSRPVAEDAERAELLRIWARITRHAKEHQRQLGLRMLASLADSVAAEAATDKTGAIAV